MNTKFKITDYGLGNGVLVEVIDTSFTHQDLYNFVGRQQYMTTFIFQEKSQSEAKYGERITGVIYYKKDKLKNTDDIENLKISIDTPLNFHNQEQKEDLKYEGVFIKDISAIYFLRIRNEIKRHETGEKKIPNVIKIQVPESFNHINIDILYINTIMTKFRYGTELVEFEKKKLIGTILGLNNFKIDKSFLNDLSFNEEIMNSDRDIYFFALKTKQRNTSLTTEEK